MSSKPALAPRIDTRDEFFGALHELQGRFAMMKPELEATVRDPDMGIEGYVVVWNTGISLGGPLSGAGKGGTRITTGVSLDEVKMLARTMALKNAAAGLPLGGSKSGLMADPKAEGFEKKYRRFVRLCAPFLHENGGPFGGFGFDIGASPIHALWACDELKSTRCFTGKPLNMGGTDYDREGIAGLGVATAGRTLLEEQGENPAQCSFAIQGLGAMGAAVLRYFSETGAKLASIADPKYGGTWAFENGISEALREALVKQDVEAAKKLIEAEGARISSDTESVLYQPVDILFPCAVQNVISIDNVSRIRARYISEGANQPVTAECYPELHARNVLVVPDFIANAGGIIAAFVELTSLAEDKVKESKDTAIARISANVRRMLEIAKQYDVETVHAGQYMALSNIFYGLAQ
jgi:glutamate dehydrogenase (NAD(P)+)